MLHRLCAIALLAASCSGAPPPARSPFPHVKTQDLTVSGRAATLYLPAFSFDASKASLLVVNDGQDTASFDIPATLEDLWATHRLAPLALLAVPAVDRIQQYGTVEHDATIACNDGTQLLGARAAEYERFVLQDLLPAAGQAAGFRPPPARTGFLGVSLGGLSAFSIAWDHPEVFGFTGAMSGSFWWRTSSASLADRQATRIQQNVVARSAPHPGFRAWLEAGTNDETADRDGNGIIDAIDDTLWLMEKMKGVGMVQDKDFIYLQVQGGTHTYATWSSVLPQFLTWAAPQ